MLNKSEQIKKTKTIKDIKKEKFDSYKILRDIRTFYESEEEDYYEPVRTSDAFDNNYIEYESNGDKDKILSVKEYLDMMRQYLSGITNNHKAQGEWKVQLTLPINFVSSKDFKGTRTMHSNTYYRETMIGSKTDEVIEEFFESLLKSIKKDLKKKWEEVNLFLMVLIYYIRNFIE